MGYFILFIFYVMVGIVTFDMSRMVRRPRQPGLPQPLPRRHRPLPMVKAYGRLLRARRAAG